jgi:ubiquinone/menaquinone biosynthesis C-methylase UbiE
MTKLLVEADLQVTAVEPVENMRAKLTEILPKVPCLKGDSWNMPLKDGSQDAIVVAQAFHWFDDVKTLKEMHRVLKPEGFGILAWNLESSERSNWVGPLRK